MQCRSARVVAPLHVIEHYDNRPPLRLCGDEGAQAGQEAVPVLRLAAAEEPLCDFGVQRAQGVDPESEWANRLRLERARFEQKGVPVGGQSRYALEHA